MWGVLEHLPAKVAAKRVIIMHKPEASALTHSIVLENEALIRIYNYIILIELISIFL